VSDDRLEFNNFDYQCLVGDELYLFSDGLFHQFGGLEGKQKLSKKRIMKRLEEVHQTSFAERKAQLNKLFDDWKGESPQTDDLVILGMKV
jgi:serine phosphatase RsbU (regulator of sigma subunit)